MLASLQCCPAVEAPRSQPHGNRAAPAGAGGDAFAKLCELAWVAWFGPPTFRGLQISTPPAQGAAGVTLEQPGELTVEAKPAPQPPR